MLKKILLAAIVLVLIASCQTDLLDPIVPEEELPLDYEVFEMEIQVQNNTPVISKETADYKACSIIINGQGLQNDYTGNAQIRGRGNSSWLWYNKKPYRIKLDEKSEILGLKSNRDWVLLANYRDPTNLMNAFGFEVARGLNMPFTNHSRFVEVTLNGDYIGLYQLTEQVEQGKNRVDVDENDGLLLSLDADDGPNLSPNSDDNFWSAVFKLPVSVKHPKDPTKDQISAIKNDFAKLEKAINTFNYDSIAVLIDIPSFIDYLIVQELVYNVEIDAPRSVFIHKDKGGKYVMGPVWDFDAGFDFDWGSMYTGHNYFNAQELVLGTDPANHKNGYRISNYFTQMFRSKQFVGEFKNRWNEVKDDIFELAWNEMEEYILVTQDAMARDFNRWPIDKNYTVEISRMKNWLSNRVPYLTTVINNYPEGSVPTTRSDKGTIDIDVLLSHSLGYKQTTTVNVEESKLISMLGISKEELYSPAINIVPLNTDGSEGPNNTNGNYGAWFETDNNPGEWANGHVFIEVFENLTMWSCGLRTGDGFCEVGDKHIVRMQYQFTHGTLTNTVTVIVNFTVDK